MTTFSEEHPLAAERAALTARAISWATDALALDDTTVSALARRLGAGWHTLWRAVRVEAARRAAKPGRLGGVVAWVWTSMCGGPAGTAPTGTSP